MQLQIETCAICQAACVFCPYPTMKRQRGTMSMDLFRKIIDDASGIPIIEVVTLTGLGEPLLDKHLIERIKYVRKVMPPGIKIDMFTNGNLLNEERSEQLADAGLSVLYVSLNAVDRRKRLAIMKLDDYDEVVPQVQKAIDIFKAKGNGQRVIVKGIVSKDLMESGEAEQFEVNWGGRSDNGGAAYLHLEGNWAGAVWPMRVLPTTACSRALSEIMVMWDGRVSLCCFDGEGEVVYGDLNSKTIKEVYNGPLATGYREAHVGGRRGELKLCATCTAI